MAVTNSISSFSSFTHPQPFSNPSNTPYIKKKLDLTIYAPKQITIEQFLKKAVFTLEEENPTQTKSLLSSLILSGSGVISDFSGNFRQVFSTYHKVYQTPNSRGLGALGFTAGLSLISGSLSVRNAFKEIATAEKISDEMGEKLGYLKVARGATLIAGSALDFPLRILSLTALVISSKTVSAFFGALGILKSRCFNFVAIFSLIAAGLRMYEYYQFNQEFESILKEPQQADSKALEYLKQLAFLTTDEKGQIHTDLLKNPEFLVLSPDQRALKVEEREGLLLQKKQAYLKRMVGEDGLNQVLEKGSEKASLVITEIQKKIQEKMMFSTLSMTLISTGLILAMASLMITGSIGSIAIAAIGVVISLSWTLIDGYDLVKEFKSAHSGQFDTLWIFTSTILGVISVALAVFLSESIAPIIAANVMGVIWLGINSACYYRLHQS